jgi:haloacetate dehalogenase
MEHRNVFEGLQESLIDAGETQIYVRHGGSGPPLLLLHGNPQTGAMWHKIAPRLAESFSVIVTDLRGYGRSGKPPSAPDHAPYSKRTMALDQLAVMRQLGHERFFLAGHDRGARVGYRMALDHPQRVARLAVLDIIPTGEAFRRTDMAFGLGYWHWFFLAQPYDLPETLMGAHPDEYWFRHTAREPKARDFFAAQPLAEYLEAFRDPATRHAICEDYRAAAGLDFTHDEADRSGARRIKCPVLALWGKRGKLDQWYDVPTIWRDWAEDVRSAAIDCGHYLAEEAPEETYAALRDFFQDARSR